MPTNPYFEIKIGGQDLDPGKLEELGVSIDYALEDADDFTKRTSAKSLNVRVPATRQNQAVANDWTNPAAEDLTPGQVHKSHRPATITAGGIELLTGKAFLLNGHHKDKPSNYNFSFYGQNGDWIIDLREATLYDFLKHITFQFSIFNITNSWNFSGYNEDGPFVFAPVRYRGIMDDRNNSDSNVDPSYLKPSISIYWVIYWAFQSLGYKIESEFMDSPDFRRLVALWTWGNFLDSDGTKLQTHKFLAKSDNTNPGYWFENIGPGQAPLQVTNDTTEGAFDNNNEYSYDHATGMTWEYKAPDHGSLDATLSCQIAYDCTLVGSNSYINYQIWWYHYDALTTTETRFKTEVILQETGHNFGREDHVDIRTFYATHNVKVGDKIRAVCIIDIYEGGGLGPRANCISSVQAFQLEYFRIPIGGTINLENYVGLKKYKFLDFLGGVVDAFNLAFDTDAINKVVRIEPTHPFKMKGALTPRSGGFFNNTTRDWSDKRDLSEEFRMDLYAEGERELTFKFKDDTNDGILKILQDRNQTTLAAGKYLLPDRFKAGKKAIENRFFAPCVHYEVPQFKGITGVAPQFITMIPENISNTSNSESANTFMPKMAYYKGRISGVGGWYFMGKGETTLPFLFAVNYKAGGHKDPVLSYGDQRINGQVAAGLLKRFYWQRLAIMREGKYYHGKMKLNHGDVTEDHRAHKRIDGQRFELVQINGYKPLKDETTDCFFRRWEPIIETDQDNTYPSEASVLDPEHKPTGNDTKYTPLICLASDIPTS